MKYLALIALSGLAQLHQASAACCRANKCLQAIAAAGDEGLADCAAKLTVTVTPSASTATVTVSVVEGAVATSLSLTTVTETAATETVLFTETSTFVITTERYLDRTPITVPVTETSTDFSTVHTTMFSYGPPAPTMKIKARETPTPQADELDDKVPDYALDACDNNFTKYGKACGCVGVPAVTVTASAEVETVTVAASTLTSVSSTYISTQTETELLTATVSSTKTDITLGTSTTTVVETVSSTTTIIQQATATSVTSISCKPNGTAKRYVIYAIKSDDGSTRWITNPGNTGLAWQTTTSTLSDSSVWSVNDDGYLENVLGYVAYIPTSTTAKTVRALTKLKANVYADVAAGTAAALSACVNPTTNKLSVTVLGRTKFFTCNNTFYISNGDGSDVANCFQLSPTANDR